MSSEIKLYNQDCMEAMKQMPDKAFDLAIVDPPYGIGINKMNMGGRKTIRPSDKKWDDCIPSQEYFDELMRVSKQQIIWGGNYFPLRPSRCFIIWDKGETMYGRDFAECECAWVSMDKSARMYKKNPVQLLRIHPTQKPVDLYVWILKNFVKKEECSDCNGIGWYAQQTGDFEQEQRKCDECDGKGIKEFKILDTHLGSGSIAIACYDTGFDLTGYEIDKDYYDAAVKRIENHKKQLTIF